nr:MULTISPECIES: Mor transcription activator family protein [unclassified Acidovorax]
MAARRHELLDDMSHTAETFLRDHDVPAAVAALLANALADHLAERWGGQMISFPKDHKRKLCEQDLEIYRKFTGHNHAELALEYKMSERGMRKLITRVCARLAKQSADDQLQLLV